MLLLSEAHTLRSLITSFGSRRQRLDRRYAAIFLRRRGIFSYRTHHQIAQMNDINLR